MFWGEFSKELRMEGQKRFKPPTFRRYQKPTVKNMERREKAGPCYIVTKCNDCPLDKVTVKQCRRSK